MPRSGDVRRLPGRPVVLSLWLADAPAGAGTGAVGRFGGPEFDARSRGFRADDGRLPRGRVAPGASSASNRAFPSADAARRGDGDRNRVVDA
mmetsp:Transcript_23965/g.74250  ORF Transcript_23965/g.74250 Transcript_23965/m.74250 type:complete len:92 (+) Transcript_23965:134-409(+)